MLNQENLPQAVFIDRDGVINKDMDNLCNIEDLKLIQGSAEGIRLLNNKGIKSIIITNQPVIAKGFCTVEELEQIHKKLFSLIERKGGHIDDLFYCPHHPEKGHRGEIPELKIECDCRKPKIGLFRKAASKYNLDLTKCYMVGDTSIDIEAGKKAGCTTILVMTGHGKKQKSFSIKPDFICSNLLEACKLISEGKK